MKIVKVVCCNCGKVIYFKSWFHWVLRCPFHWFDKRLTKCPHCGEKQYMRRAK